MKETDKKQIRIPENLGEILKKIILKKDRLVILILTGVLLMIIAIPVPGGENDGTETKQRKTEAGEETVLADEDEYVSWLEEKLADTLSRAEGVGQVEVMITLCSSAEKIVEKDVESESEDLREEDSQGGNRITQSTISSEVTVYGTGEEGADGDPYITKEISPVIEGVVVIAEGGDNSIAVQNITEAVKALFDIDTHKIKIMKGN